jgi:hypothetical protein
VLLNLAEGGHAVRLRSVGLAKDVYQPLPTDEAYPIMQSTDDEPAPDETRTNQQAEATEWTLCKVDDRHVRLQRAEPVTARRSANC